MTQLDIFDTIVGIMQEDSSTKKDKKGADPTPYRDQLLTDLPKEDFIYLVRTYLASFGVLGHIWYHSPAAPRLGAFLRRHEDSLYVLDSDSGNGLEVGDRIIAIGGQPLDQVYQEHQAFFVSPTPERQYMEWAYLVKKAEQVSLFRNGQFLQVEIGDCQDSAEQEAFAWNWLDDHTLYMKMENFYDEEKIGQLYTQIEPLLPMVKNLIIDVRVNSGGSDSLYWPLLKYALPAGKSYKDMVTDEVDMEILYTSTNVAHRRKLFEQDLRDPHLSAESRAFTESLLADLEVHQGAGFVCADDEEDYLAEYRGLEGGPNKIYILSDVRCASSGDNFVQTFKPLPKVTVVGRATLGILDYSNCCFAEFGDDYLMYPTSRSLEIDKGNGMTDRGVEPDIYIPWTPEHLERDVDLDYVLKLIQTSEIF